MSFNTIRDVLFAALMRFHSRPSPSRGRSHTVPIAALRERSHQGRHLRINPQHIKERSFLIPR